MTHPEQETTRLADAARAQGFGGIMGGGDSEVTGTTTTIAVESAHFAPAQIRRTSILSQRWAEQHIRSLTRRNIDAKSRL